MNDNQDDRNDISLERYRAYLEGKTDKQLDEIINEYSRKQKMDIIQDADPVGRGDGNYEP